MAARSLQHPRTLAGSSRYSGNTVSVMQTREVPREGCVWPGRAEGARVGATLRVPCPRQPGVAVRRRGIKRLHFTNTEVAVWGSSLCAKPFTKTLNSKVARSLQRRPQRDAFRRRHSCPASLRAIRDSLVGQPLCQSAFKCSVLAPARAREAASASHENPHTALWTGCSPFPFGALGL